LSGRIVILSEEIANKIAAGEVVERPASIVKELLENSIDAGANDIRVELERGGCRSIKVVDNGLGIETEDVPLVFERHSTSKIHKFEDIFHVVSFGFRGEAMPSIASVAEVELLTRRKNALSGTKVTVAAGKIKNLVPAGCPEGTQVVVTKIFANVPARQKFLKTEATEQGACLDVITRLALAHPEIRFKVLVNGREVFAAPETLDPVQRISMVMGEEFSMHCIAVDERKENMSLTGFISRPEYTRSNSRSIYLFVNKRFVRDHSVTFAVSSAYRQIIEPRRYPAAVLFIDLPPQDVDVNVHPAKMEVRFRNTHEVYELVSKTISLALADAETSRGNFVYHLTPAAKKQVSHTRLSVRENFPSIPLKLFSRQNLQQAIHDDLLMREVHSISSAVSHRDQPGPVETSFATMKFIGQYADTYLIFEGEECLILLDQHAAHERIILEKLKKSAECKVTCQFLLMPEIVHLTPGQVALFSTSIDFLKQMGLDMEIFGYDAIVVKGIPPALSQLKISELISDIADHLVNLNEIPSFQDKRDKIFASLACKAAIKAKRVLSYEEVSALCRELDETPFRLTCPHGRPITISFSLNEIERIFKRK